MNLLMKIVKSCGNLTDKTVVEVGAGPGNLTRWAMLVLLLFFLLLYIVNSERC
jgi:hypothetical protein